MMVLVITVARLLAKVLMYSAVYELVCQVLIQIVYF